MDALSLMISLALGFMVLALILYPLWQQTRPEAIFRVDRAGQTLEEYQARYQAVLAAIKDLMFDYEMGKVTAEDYEPLLARSKMEAANLRRHIDRLSSGNELDLDPAVEAAIEKLVAQLRGSQVNGNDALLREVEAEIESLKHITFAGAAVQSSCPNCGQAYQIGDAFCTACGQSLPADDACPECGQPVEPDDAFCAKCGAPLTENQTA
ncbi:MAG: zinc ribbon domain-containing protein [Chloroflexota bacterium]